MRYMDCSAEEDMEMASAICGVMDYRWKLVDLREYWDRWRLCH